MLPPHPLLALYFSCPFGWKGVKIKSVVVLSFNSRSRVFETSGEKSQYTAEVQLKIALPQNYSQLQSRVYVATNVLSPLVVNKPSLPSRPMPPAPIDCRLAKIPPAKHARLTLRQKRCRESHLRSCSVPTVHIPCCNTTSVCKQVCIHSVHLPIGTTPIMLWIQAAVEPAATPAAVKPRVDSRIGKPATAAAPHT